MSLHDKVLTPASTSIHPNPNVDWAKRRSGSRRCASGRAVLRCRPLGRGQRVRFRRYELPRRAGGVRSGPATAPTTAARSFAGERPHYVYCGRSPGDGYDAQAAVAGSGRGRGPRRGRRRRATRPAPRPAPGRPGARCDRPDPAWLAAAPVRVAIDFGDAAELAAKAGKALTALRGGNAAMWRLLRAQGSSWSRSGAQGRVPLHRPGLPVRQHAAPTA